MHRALLLLLALWGSTVVAAQPPLRFAPLPMVSDEAMRQEYLAPLRHLEGKLGRNLELVHTRDYQALIERFRRNEIDLAILGPLPYVMLSQDYTDAVPLVRFLEADGRDRYTCALVVFGHSPLRPADLAGKRLALPDPLSTCGDVGMGAILATAGVSLDKTQRSYLDRHDAVALAVILDQADAGGLKTSIARKYASLGLKILLESPPYPGFVLVANRQTVDEATQEQLRRILLGLQPAKNPADALLMRNWGVTMRFGAVPVEDDDYASLRQQWVDKDMRR